MFWELSRYDKVVVLTGRDVKDRQFTIDQLKRSGVEFTTLVSCPRKMLTERWKVSIVKSYGKNGPVVWFDDMFSEAIPEELRSGAIPNVIPRDPRTITKEGSLQNRRPKSGFEEL